MRRGAPADATRARTVTRMAEQPFTSTWTTDADETTHRRDDGDGGSLTARVRDDGRYDITGQYRKPGAGWRTYEMVWDAEQLDRARAGG